MRVARRHSKPGKRLTHVRLKMIPAQVSGASFQASRARRSGTCGPWSALAIKAGVRLPIAIRD